MAPSQTPSPSKRAFGRWILIILGRRAISPSLNQTSVDRRRRTRSPPRSPGPSRIISQRRRQRCTPRRGAKSIDFAVCPTSVAGSRPLSRPRRGRLTLAFHPLHMHTGSCVAPRLPTRRSTRSSSVVERAAAKEERNRAARTRHSNRTTTARRAPPPQRVNAAPSPSVIHRRISHGERGRERRRAHQTGP